MITTCNSPVAITRIRTFSVTCVMAFSTMPTDADSYLVELKRLLGHQNVPSTLWSQRHERLTWLVECPTWQSSLGTQVCSTTRLLPWSLSGLPHLCIEQTCSRSSYSAWLSPPETGWLPLVCSPAVSVSEEPVIHACNKQTVLRFMPSFVNVRPPNATNTNASWVAISGSGGFMGWIFDLAVLVSPTSSSPKIVHHGLVYVCLNEWFQRSFMWSHQSVPRHSIGCVFCGPINICLINEKCWNAEAPCPMKNAAYPSLSLKLSSWNTTRSLCFCVFANSAFFKWHKSIKFAKRTVFQSFFAGRTTSDFYFTFCTHHAGKFFNLSHYLSTAACKWFSFWLLDGLVQASRNVLYGRVVFWNFENLQLTH